MRPTIFTAKASKMIVSCEASSKFHRTVLPKRAFRAMLPTIFTQNLRFATVSRDRHTDSCERVHPPNAKCAHTTTPCIPKFQNVRFATAACAKMYESINREPTRFAHTEMSRFTTVLDDRRHVFTERVARRQMKFAFRYSFGRSTPRFYREIENEICVSLQFWAIDTTFLARGLTESK